MNRKIIFRGKRIDNGEWIYGSFAETHGTPFIGIPTDPDNPVYMMDWHEVDPDTVGQFTGMLDKNCEEIYEGDIVRYYDDIEDELVSSHVIYHKESCSFCAAPTKLCGDYVGITSYWQFEVIGNIHNKPRTAKREVRL